VCINAKASTTQPPVKKLKKKGGILFTYAFIFSDAYIIVTSRP